MQAFSISGQQKILNQASSNSQIIVFAAQSFQYNPDFLPRFVFSFRFMLYFLENTFGSVSFYYDGSFLCCFE